jgi:phosphate uptake regulator
MFREFLSIFRTHDPLRAMAEDFARMLTQTYEMTRVAGDIYFAGAASTEERRLVYGQDIEVNKLERRIRKQVIAHLSIRSNAQDLPYCLFLFSLVKDVERLGDYAKNLTEVMDIRPGPLPEDEIRAELESVRREVDATFRVAGDIVSRGDREQARELTESGRKLAKRCEATMRRIAAADYDSNTAVAAVLGARYYKRIGGHLTNVLTSVFMPLHKLDYFDEDELGKGGRPPA